MNNIKVPHVITLDHLRGLAFAEEMLCRSYKYYDQSSHNYPDCNNLTRCANCLFNSETAITQEEFKNYLIDNKIITKAELFALNLEGILT